MAVQDLSAQTSDQTEAPDVSDCCCIACGGDLDAILPGGEDFIEGRYACRDCGKTFDEVWGVPFFLEYDKADFASLVEIAANAGLSSPHTPAGLDYFYARLVEYDVAENRAAFEAEAGASIGPWLPLRHGEWKLIEFLADGEDYSGRRVLDVGAGLGFDSWRHVVAGAAVTAVEHSPVLTREGRRTLPMIRWLGAAAHMLPFKNGSFDAVFCNAALHHMRDVPTALREMLRVLRPGGVLITTGDSFRPDDSADDTELAVFNNHTEVLSGINEQLPRLREFLSGLAPVRSHIEPRLFTTVLYEDTVSGRRTDAELREWNLETDQQMLALRSGTIAMKIKLLRPLDFPAARQSEPGMFAPAKVSRWLETQSAAMAKLAPWAPEEVINRPFPGGTGDKFDLLNGWQLPTGAPLRRGYRRGRWYLRRGDVRQQVLYFEVRSTSKAAFDILLNGQTVRHIEPVGEDWTAVTINVGLVPLYQTFAVEIRLLTEANSLAEGVFEVRRRRMQASDAQTGPSLAVRASEARAAVMFWGERGVALLRRALLRLRMSQARSARQ